MTVISPKHATVAIPTIVDVEASGFGKGGYPIEIGYVAGDGTSYCTLIKPAPGWTHWDASAQSMHGISREVLLLHGREPAEVARELNRRLQGETIYSDGWSYDLAWLAKLYDAVDLVPRFRVESLRSLLSDAEAAQWHEAKDRAAVAMHATRHRASADAQLLQRALLHVKGIEREQ